MNCMYMKLFSIFFKKVCLQHNWLTTVFVYNWLPQLIKIEICALPPISGRQAEYSVLLKSEFLFPSFINNAFEVAVAATFLHSISVTMLAVTYHSACWTLFRNSGCMKKSIVQRNTYFMYKLLFRFVLHCYSAQE